MHFIIASINNDARHIWGRYPRKANDNAQLGLHYVAVLWIKFNSVSKSHEMICFFFTNQCNFYPLTMRNFFKEKNIREVWVTLFFVRTKLAKARKS